jgi:hypothetical protein
MNLHFVFVGADKCSSAKVNTNDNMVEDHSGSMKPPKKGRKIKLASNGSILSIVPGFTFNLNTLFLYAACGILYFLGQLQNQSCFISQF